MIIMVSTQLRPPPLVALSKTGLPAVCPQFLMFFPYNFGPKFRRKLALNFPMTIAEGLASWPISHGHGGISNLGKSWKIGSEIHGHTKKIQAMHLVI